MTQIQEIIKKDTSDYQPILKQITTILQENLFKNKSAEHCLKLLCPMPTLDDIKKDINFTQIQIKQLPQQFGKRVILNESQWVWRTVISDKPLMFNQNGLYYWEIHIKQQSGIKIGVTSYINEEIKVNG